MSDQEQHEIIGRTVLEHGEAKRKLAALEAKARLVAAFLRAIARELHPIGEIVTRATFESRVAESCSGPIESYPDRADVLALFAELRETRAKIQELTQLLHDMGVRP